MLTRAERLIDQGERKTAKGQTLMERAKALLGLIKAKG